MFETSPVSDTGQVMWSVRIEQPGTYEGFIHPAFSLPKFSAPAKSEQSLTHQEPARNILPMFVSFQTIPILVEIKPRLVRVETIISLATGFFGSLLTLPGILSFIDQRRKARRGGLSSSGTESWEVLG